MKHKKLAISEHLASLSVQYGLFPAELFQALVTAREHKKARCQTLIVEYRGSVDKEAIFLVKQDNNVIVQFRVPEETLKEKNLSFDHWMDSDKIQKQISKQNPTEPISTPISKLRHGMKRVNLDAKVLQVEEPRMVHTQFGSNALLANAIIEDETGKVKLCLWDQQVHSVHPGDSIQICNASVSTFKGEKQLRLGKAGELAVVQHSNHSEAKSIMQSPSKKTICA